MPELQAAFINANSESEASADTDAPSHFMKTVFLTI